MATPIIKQIESLRKKRELSVSELCRLSGVARRTYYNALEGSRDTGIEQLQALAKALGAKLRLDTVDLNRKLYDSLPEKG